MLGSSEDTTELDDVMGVVVCCDPEVELELVTDVVVLVNDVNVDFVGPRVEDVSSSVENTLGSFRDDFLLSPFNRILPCASCDLFGHIRII